MFIPSVTIAPMSYIMPMMNMWDLFLQQDVLYNENLMKWMAWRTSASICRCKARAQMNLTTIMDISLPSLIFSIWESDEVKIYALYNASAICIKNMKMLVLKLTASSSG